VRGALAIAALAALLGVGCATVPDDADGASRGVASSEGRRWLERGIALFEQGRFAEAVRVLQASPEIVADDLAVRTQSLKYQAFGQCVTGRKTACRRTFDALLSLDPAFALAPAEAGHPSWGPAFEQARAAQRVPSAVSTSRTQ
jgi:hypothetical protein